MQTPRISLMLLALALCVLLSGCASNADTVPSPSPGNMGGASPSASAAMPSASPMAGMPGASQSPGGEGGDTSGNTGGNTGGETGGNAAETLSDMDDVKKVSGDVRDAAGKLTEVDEATVVAVNDYALVGVKYDGQYQAGMTERLRNMILARAKAADSRVKAVYVTDDEALIERIKSIETSLETAQDTVAISSEADALRGQMERTE